MVAESQILRFFWEFLSIKRQIALFFPFLIFSFATVRKLKSILLLMVMAISLLPWSMLDICPLHPEGHEGHHGSCESGMMDEHHEPMADEEAQATLMASPCTTLSAATDDYTTNPHLTVPTISQYAVLAVLLDLIQWEQPEQAFFPTPDPQSNSDPPLGINALRGPPIV